MVPIENIIKVCTVIGKVKQHLALIGANGMLASAINKLAPEIYEIIPFDLPDFDLTNHHLLFKSLRKARPKVIVNCAAYTDVDGCESEEELAKQVNGKGPGYLANAAKEMGATLVHISTDFVFDGEKTEPYIEVDPVNPQSAYGRTKAVGEQAVLDSGLNEYFIVRTSWLYGPGGKNFVDTIIRLAKEREKLRIVSDQVGTPTYTEDLAQAIFSLLALDGSQFSPVPPYGIYHFSNEGECTWYDFAKEIVYQLNKHGVLLRVKELIPIRTEEYPLPAKRPAYSVLSKEKIKAATGLKISDWKSSLEKHLTTF
ncbi:MAG: dTDP-4-dehydrorhamnose reductase [Thermodesulfobacteriota bacterium]|nr:dTDP-4-dehydrorhamnose reductase [Thermodesulfobacteriota bacterium]